MFVTWSIDFCTLLNKHFAQNIFVVNCERELNDNTKNKNRKLKLTQ